jgi:hypothetical protein
MGLGKTFTKTLKSNKDLKGTYDVCKKLCNDGKLKLKSDVFSQSGFEVHATEPMKWLTTNWPNNIRFIGEVFDGAVIVRLEATSNGTSITQDKNIADFLDNYSSSLNSYLS